MKKEQDLPLMRPGVWGGSLRWLVAVASGLCLCLEAGTLYAVPLESRPIVGRDMVRQQGWHRLDFWQILREEAQNLKSMGLHREVAVVLGQADEWLQKQKGRRQSTILRNQLEMIHALIRVGDPDGEKKLHEFLATWKKTLSEDNPEVLYARHLLASCQIARGDLTGADKTLKDVIERRAKVLGPGHPDTLASRTNLAHLMTSQLFHDEAAIQLRLVVTAEATTFGEDHPQTCASRALLARNLQAKYKMQEALTEYELVLQGVQKAYGPRHPQTFQAAYNVASAMYQMHHREKAENVFKQLTRQIVAVAGADSPDTIIFRKGLADCLGSRGLLTSAEMQYREIIRILRLSGTPDPSVMRQYHVALEEILNHRIPMDAAGLKLVENLERYRKTLGSDHKLAVDALQSVVWWRRDHGEFIKAEQGLTELIAARERVNGPDDWITWQSRSNHADALTNVGRFDDAVALQKRHIAYLEKKAGDLHPETAFAQVRLALTLSSIGQEVEALPLLKAAYTRIAKVYGAEGVEAREVQLRLAMLYRDVGQFAESEKHYRELCASLPKLVGGDDARTSDAYGGYAWVLLKTRRAPEAETLLRTGQQQVGKGQMDGMEAVFFRGYLMLALVQQGKFKQASEYIVECQRLLKLKRGQLGPHGILLSNSVAMTLLANGRMQDALTQVLFSYQLCLEARMLETGGPYLETKCTHAMVLRYQNKTTEWQEVASELEVLLPGAFWSGEPILLMPKLLAKEGTPPFHALVDAIVFSERRSGMRHFRTPEDTDPDFPSGAPVDIRKEMLELYFQAQELAARGDHLAACEKFREFGRQSEPLVKSDSMTLAEIYVRAAFEAVRAGSEDLAREMMSKVMDLVQPLHADKARFVGEVMQQLPGHIVGSDDAKQARAFSEIAVAASSERLGDPHVLSSTARLTLLDCLLQAQLPEAGDLLKKHAQVLEATFGPTNLDAVDARMSLLRWHAQRKEFHEVHAVANALVEPMAKLYGAYSDDTLSVREAIVGALEGQGLTSMALSEHRQILGEWEAAKGADSVHTVFLRHRLAMSLQRAKQLEEAVELHGRNAAILTKQGGERNIITVEIWLNQSLALITLKRPGEAIEPASKALAIGSELLGPDHDMMKNARILLETAKKGGSGD